MTETKCRWDSEASAYLTEDGEVCDTPKRDHCTTRRTCAIHLGWGELTCARCLGRTRQDIRQIVERAALMLPEAMVVGINSEAANLAGPGIDPRGWTEYRLAATRHLDHWLRKGKINERQHTAARDQLDDDEFHPYNILTRWHMMLAEDYSDTLPAKMTITDSAAYLDRNLGKVAQDERQDFPLMAREIRKCRSHLEAVLRDSLSPERGAPCPECKGAGTLVRLVREYSHWCDDEACERIHVADESEDMWVCPRDRMHAWTPEAYRNYLEERVGA